MNGYSRNQMSRRARRLLLTAVLCTLTGLVCVLLFLWFGFLPWTVGVGVFLGFPLLLIGIVLYLAAVIGDLRRRRAL